MGEVVLHAYAAKMETHEGEPERLRTAEDDSTRVMVVAADHPVPVDVIASLSNDSVDTKEEGGEALKNEKAYTEATEEADDDQAPGSVSVPAPAPAIAPAPAPAQAPYVK